MKAERKIAAKARPDAAKHAAAKFIEVIAPTPNDVVALYYPIHTELDTQPLAAALMEAQIPLALPVTQQKKSPLIFRHYDPNAPLIPGPFGELTPDNTAPETTPTIIVVPLIAFDTKAWRLGYGGGYYDRTLTQLRAKGPVMAVGYAYGDQEVDAVPVSDLDQPLDFIITERKSVRR